MLEAAKAPGHGLEETTVWVEVEFVVGEIVVLVAAEGDVQRVERGVAVQIDLLVRVRSKLLEAAALHGRQQTVERLEFIVLGADA